MVIFLGVDVSEDRLDCAIISNEEERPLGQKCFSNDKSGIEKAVAWLWKAAQAAPADVHAILEPTAAHHELAARLFVANGMTVSLVNPAQVRSFAKGVAVLGKTDRIDALLLARYGRLARPGMVSAQALTDLQAFIARLDDIESDLRREENRFEQACARGW